MHTPQHWILLSAYLIDVRNITSGIVDSSNSFFTWGLESAVNARDGIHGGRR